MSHFVEFSTKVFNHMTKEKVAEIPKFEGPLSLFP
jgi:hypothetical protein